MADISSIKLPNGNVYNFKDSLNRKYTSSIFAPETASGSIAHFNFGDDGIEATPWLEKLKVTINPKQSGSGDPSPENVRPISGWNSVKIYTSGRNMLNYNGFSSGTSSGITRTANGNGSFSVSGTNTSSSAQAAAAMGASYGVLLKAGVGYTIKGNWEGITASSSGLYFDVRPVNDGATVLFTETRSSAYIPTEDIIVRIHLRAAGSYTVPDGVTAWPVLTEYGEDTSFVPYQGNSIDVSIPASAGTVYGGTLTYIGNHKWELVADTGLVDMGTLSWTYNSSFAIPCFHADISGGKVQSVNGQETYIYLCSAYKLASKTALRDADFGNVYPSGYFAQNGHLTNCRVMCTNSDYTDAAAFKASVSGQTLAYRLAEPLTYIFTTSEIITLLKGENNVWADCDDVEVYYFAKLTDQESQQNIKSLTDSTSASGDIITLNLEDRGLNAKPQITKLSIPIEPKQDFNGYDRPWPGGAGKNLIPLTVEVLKAHNTSGTWSGNAYTYRGITFTLITDNGGNVTGIQVAGTNTSSAGATIEFPYIDVPAGTYYFSGLPDELQTRDEYLGNNVRGSSQYLWYDSSEKRVTVTATDEHHTGTAWITVTAGNTASGLVYHPMLRSSDVTDNTFEPYENLCPITGLDGVNLTTTGSNMISPFFNGTNTALGITYTFSDNNVSITGTSTATNADSSNKSLRHPLKLLAGKTYVFSIGGTWSTSALRLFLRTAENSNLWYGDSTNCRWTVTPTRDITVEKIMLRVRVNNATFNVSGPFYCNYASLSEYKEYEGRYYPISFASTAGTVYGGNLTYEDGQWKVMVDRSIATFDGSEEWTVTSDTMPSYRSKRKNIPANASGLVCNKLIFDDTQTPVSGHGYIGITNIVCYFSNASEDNLAEWKASLAVSPIQIVYYNVNPTTYILEGPDLKTVYGVNHIWSDADHIDLEYKIDTTSDYVDPLLALLKSIIADNLDSYVAADNYAIGKFLVICNRFYKVTDVVSSGQSLVPGTNITETTIGDQLTALFASI